MDYMDFERAINNFLDTLTNEFDDNLDPDGSHYNNALKYAKENNIDTKDINEVADAIRTINNTENKLVKLLDDANKEEKEDIESKLDKLHSLNIGLMSMMLELRKGNFKA